MRKNKSSHCTTATDETFFTIQIHPSRFFSVRRMCHHYRVAMKATEFPFEFLTQIQFVQIISRVFYIPRLSVFNLSCVRFTISTAHIISLVFFFSITNFRFLIWPSFHFFFCRLSLVHGAAQFSIHLKLTR